MRKIISYLRQFWKEDFSLPTYVLTAAFIIGLLVLNYQFGLAESTVYNRRITGLPKVGLWILFFAVPYFGTLGIQAIFQGLPQTSRKPGLWLSILVILSLLILTIAAPWHKSLARSWFPRELLNWGILLLWNLKRVVFTLLPLFFFWLLLERKKNRFYGLFEKPHGMGVYAMMLLVVLPMVIIASFLPGFQHAYPQYKPGIAEVSAGVSPWLTCGLFELIYGIDFTIVELSYRGFLVIGLSRWLGPRTVLPMVTLYCAIHFGKPLGEAIGSAVGGYILGVIAYYSRNIWGGILVHVGLAYMMEVAGHLQMHF